MTMRRPLSATVSGTYTSSRIVSGGISGRFGGPDRVERAGDLHHRSRARLTLADESLVGPVRVALDPEVARHDPDPRIGELRDELAQRALREPSAERP